MNHVNLLVGARVCRGSKPAGKSCGGHTRLWNAASLLRLRGRLQVHATNTARSTDVYSHSSCTAAAHTKYTRRVGGGSVCPAMPHTAYVDQVSRCRRILTVPRSITCFILYSAMSVSHENFPQRLFSANEPAEEVVPQDLERDAPLRRAQVEAAFQAHMQFRYSSDWAFRDLRPWGNDPAEWAAYAIADLDLRLRRAECEDSWQAYLQLRRSADWAFEALQRGF